MRLLMVLLIFLTPGLAVANCGGTDQRPLLSAAQNAEIAARMENVPFASGNHWIATRGSRTIHVIGTMHANEPRMDALAGRLAPVIQSADVLLVESTKADQDQLQRDLATKPELAFLTGDTLIDLMAPDAWTQLAEAAAARGIPSFMAAKFQPWYLSLLLSMSPCTLQEIAAGGVGLDQRLMDIAEQASIPSRSLEPYTTLFEIFAQDSMEEQLAMLSVGIMPDDVSENATITLVEQYFEEEHVVAQETARVITRAALNMEPAAFDALFDVFMQRLLDQRNLRWMSVIAAAEGDRIVVAAGALHLGGQMGVLNLLAQDGYTLTRSPF